MNDDITQWAKGKSAPTPCADWFDKCVIPQSEVHSKIIMHGIYFVVLWYCTTPHP